MYRKFYKLTRLPFEVSPDIGFFYQTPQHNEALAILHYGVLRRRGLVVVTGEVGTGKTLLVHCLLETLNRNHVAAAFICNPRLSIIEFLSTMLRDLRLPGIARTKSELLSYFTDYLLIRCRRGATTALIVDEAQLLGWEMLEEIRLLSNLETPQGKLLQIVLVGQPELDDKIDSEDLRQLKQRIAMRCRLEPLSMEELRGYILQRLALAGANSHGGFIFPRATIEAVHKFSRGIPRLVNTLCENSLISGFGRQAEWITPEIVQEVAADLRLKEPTILRSGDFEERKKVLKVRSGVVVE